MGEIIKNLSFMFSNEESLYSSSVRFESAEKIHFHWRNLRIILSEEQFESLFKCSAESFKKFNDIDRISGEGNGILLDDKKLTENTEKDISIELIKNNVVHFHFKDLRLELKIGEFLDLCEVFKVAKKSFNALNDPNIQS